jgi:hypothetical protein
MASAITEAQSAHHGLSRTAARELVHRQALNERRARLDESRRSVAHERTLVEFGSEAAEEARLLAVRRELQASIDTVFEGNAEEIDGLRIVLLLDQFERSIEITPQGNTSGVMELKETF